MTKKQYSVKEVFDSHIKDGVVAKHTGFLLLYDLVRYFRPKRVSYNISLLELIGYLQENPEQCKILGAYIKDLLSGRQFGRMIRVSFMNSTDAFWPRYSPFSLKKIPYNISSTKCSTYRQTICGSSA